METGKLYRVNNRALSNPNGGNINEDVNLALVRNHGYIWVGPKHFFGRDDYYTSLATGEHAIWYRRELDLLEE